jgi:adenosylcobinamide kinase/adenosylcobinamide-phosphate guanylyltransferase
MTEGKSMLILVLGGARSGKSCFAQSYAGELERSGKRRVVFIATAGAGDEEMRRRIEAHRKGRPAAWETVEEPLRVSHAIAGRCAGRTVAIVDCLTLLISNVVAERCAMRTGTESIPLEEELAVQAAVDGEVAGIIDAVRSVDCTALIVSNEVGLGIVPHTPLGRLFRDVAGMANRRLARESDEVYFLVAGIPQRIK